MYSQKQVLGIHREGGRLFSFALLFFDKSYFKEDSSYFLVEAIEE